MKDERLLFFTDIQFLEPVAIEENPMLSKVKIKIAQSGINRNGYDIPKAVLEDAAKTSLGLTPIVAYYNQYKGDFGEHGTQAVYNQLGEYVTTADTQAVGVIPENPIIYWDEDNYLVTYGYLWTSRYAELIDALDGRPQSMELSFENTIMHQKGRIMEITKTAFVGLCILGNDVTPAFADASIEGVNFSYQPLTEQEDKVEEGVDELMDALKFALDNNFDDSALGTPLVVDTDGEERDKVNREKITEAVDLLDEAADLVEDEEARNRIDDAISGLVDAEIDMKREADIIPVTEAAHRGLQGQPGYKDGIVSVENLNYKKASNSLLKKNEDEKEEEKELDIKKKKEEEIKKDPVTQEPVEKETKVETEVNPEDKSTETKQVEETKEPVSQEEDQPSEEVQPGGQSGAEQRAAEPEKTTAEPEATGVQTDTVEEETGQPGEEVQEDPQGATAATIAEERETAKDKRTSALLSDVGDDELFDYLIERVAAADEMRTKLQEMLGTAVPEGLPEGGDVTVEGETTEEDLGTETVSTPADATEPEIDVKSDKPDSELAAEGEDMTDEETLQEDGKEVVKADKTIEVTDGGATDEGGETSPAPEQAEEKSEKSTPEDKSVVEETEEERKKKKKLDYSLDFKAIIAENQQLTVENENLRQQNEALLQFKLEAEREAKENLLLEFSLSDEGKDKIRAKFDELTLEEVEAQAALAQHREFKEAHGGQKESDEGIQFSLESEETELDALDEEDSLALFLEKISKKNKRSRF
ncbi:hypothetical protein ZYGNAAKF_CDS0004 [Enterococcus phage VRE9_2]